MFRIHLKITLFYAVFTTFLFFVIYLLLLDYVRKTNYRETQQGLKSNLYILKAAVQDSAALDNRFMLENISRSITNDLKDRMTLIDRNGRVLFDSEIPFEKLGTVNNHSNRTEVLGAFRSGFGESRHYSQTVGREMIYQAVLITNRSRPYILRLSVPYTRILDLDGVFGSYILTILLIILLVSALTGYLVFRIITSKLENMISWSQKIAAGDYTGKVLHFSRDEVGVLAESLHTMSEDFRTKIAELDIGRLRLEKLVMTLMDGILVISSDGHVILINESLEKVLGTVLPGRRYFEVIRDHHIIEFIENTVLSDGGIRKTEAVLNTDRERIYELYGIPVFKNGKPDWSLFVFHDVTEIRQLDNRRRDFVANVSHELKTPVSVIKGYAETLLNGALNDGENARKFLQNIDNDATRLSKLVDDLLKLSGLESGQIQPDFAPCSVLRIAEKVCVSLGKFAMEKNIRLENLVPEDFPEVPADEDKIEEVLINLTENALKYTPENGRVAISAEDTGNSVRVSVTDNGIGIAKDKIPRLFERFYRVDTGRSRKLGGTGLGLAIVKHIVQIHNGNVEVQSRPGEGSVFSFTIPKTVK